MIRTKRDRERELGIAGRIRGIRKKSALSQAALARKIEEGSMTIFNVERGHSMASYQLVKKVAELQSVKYLKECGFRKLMTGS